MAPRIEIKNAEGQVIEEFGTKTTNTYPLTPFKVGEYKTYANVIKRDGTIEVYRQDLIGQTLVGSYSPDGVWTHNTLAYQITPILEVIDNREEKYFNDALTRRIVRGHAEKVVEKDILAIKNDQNEIVYGTTSRTALAQNIVYGTELSAEDLNSLVVQDNRDTLAGSVEIEDLPSSNTINIEGEAQGEYGNYYYPLALASGDTRQDRIKFSMRIPSGTKVDPFLFKNEKIFQRQLSPIIGSVTLPIQPMISDRNTVDFSGLQLNAVDAAIAGVAYNLADSDSLTELFEKGGTAARAVQQQILNAKTGTQEGLKVFLAQQAAGVQGLLSRTTGAVLNPNLELLFRGPQLRPFSFTFTLSPRSEEEAKQVRSIIYFFKRGMSVKTTASNVFLKSPNVFDIKYQTYKKDGTLQENHQSINRIKTCALVDCGVEYTPDGSYMTFNDEERTMTSYKINLQFSELDPIYDKDYPIMNKDLSATEIGF